MKRVFYWATVVCLGLGVWKFYGISPILAEPGKPAAVSWQILQELDYTTGKTTPELAKLVRPGMTVRVPGFMVPLEDSADAVQEFLLIPYGMACAHVPPPPPNQMVHVKMRDAKKQKVLWGSPIWVHGQLQVTTTANPDLPAAYTMTGTLVELYQPSTMPTK